jgi:hypothetical protein
VRVVLVELTEIIEDSDMANIRRFAELLFNPHELLGRLRPRLRNLHREERYAAADERVRQLMDEGYLKLRWSDVFGEETYDSELFIGMKNEIKALTVDSSVEFGGEKSSYLVKRYTSGISITDAFLLRFVHHREIDYYLRQYFGGNYLTNHYDYWKTSGSDGARIGSQRWHTDPEDPVMLKIFVYFSEVNKRHGATEIIAGTQVNGRKCIRKWHQKKLTGGYIEEDTLKTKIHNFRDLICEANGIEGEILFLDTTALHRGGHGTESRQMANITFTSTNCRLPFKWSASN